NEVYDTILNGLSKTIENKKFTDKDAENIVKIVGGENVFEREEVEDLIDEVINDYKEGKLENQEIFNITGELRKKMIEQGYNESQRDEAVEQLARKLNWEIGEDGKIIKAAEAAETGSEKKISHQEAQLRRAEMADNEINKYFIQGTMEPKKSLKEMENERAGRAREEINNTLSDTEMYEREELIEELKERYLALWGERSAILGESGTDRTERFRDVEKKIGEIEKEFARLGMKIDLFKWIGEKEETVKGSKALAEPVSTVGEDEKEIIREEVETEEEKKNAEIEKAILEELEKMPQKEKIKLSKGLANLGLYVEYGKNSFFSNVLNRLTKPIAKKDKHIAEQGTLARFLISMAENYGKDAERAENKLMQKGRKGLVNYRYIASNISMYGRNLADVVGWTAASPFRYIMAGTMFFARGAQAAKEARLKNKEVMEKTRIDDIDKAEEEAWEIYKSARDRGKDQVTGEYLEKAYQKNLPKDLLNRLKNRVNAGQTYNIIGNIVAKDIGRSVKKIEMKLDNIEKNKKLSKEERTIKKEKILEKYNKFLKDLDGMVSKYGAIDGLALGAKYAETGAKTVIAGLTVESLYLLTQNLPKLYNDLHNLYDSISAEDGTVGKGIETAAVKHPIMPGQRPAGHAERPAVLSEIEKIKENIAQEAALRKGKFDLAAIHDKEGIEHAIRRQLEAEPENYGYKGNMNDKAAIHKWSGGEADRAAIKAGYVNPETGEEIRVGAKGIDKAAYVLEKDAQGKTQIHEYFKGEDGSFKSQEVHGLAENFKGAKFEGADKEFYEYEHKGGAEGKILHLMNHKNNLDQAAESIKMVEGANVSYDDAYEYFYQFKNVSGNPGRMEGIVEILKHHDYKSGLSKIFGVAVTEKNFEVKGGVYRIKDFKPGFDYVVKIDGGEMKFGVDGPLGQWNWGARGRTWRAYIDADLTNENLEKSKSEVENMLKIFEKRR
ncbi:hypothetical protein KKC04_01660, partial [Patescibacteria group bacterium]|nr:hypothetical protein [Patescibacteria group bacterium]